MEILLTKAQVQSVVEDIFLSHAEKIKTKDGDLDGIEFAWAIYTQCKILETQLQIVSTSIVQ